MPTLDFKGKSVIETYHHSIPHHTLEFDPKLSLLPKGQKPSLDGNLIIEGDNLLALKALLPTHAGKIKCIYIDPPYNTGNEGWVYNDNLTQPQFKEWIGQTVGKEGEDATRHDKWCCMMYPRLQLLRELLADDGIILISIDDTEVQNLRIMMDDIFGGGSPGETESSFLGTLAWKTRNTDNRLSSNFSLDHEYVLIYRKTSSGALNGRKIDRSDFQNPDNDPRGPYVTDPLTGKATAEKRRNLHYVVINPETGDQFDPDPSRGWITDKSGMDELIKDKRIWWPPDSSTGKPRKKRFLSETKERMPEGSFWADVRGQSGSDELDQILGKRLFDFPKLSDFIVRLLDVSCPSDSTILDCTAGSGTTGHAALILNKKDGGSRRFILVQQKYDTKEQEAEKLNICERVTRERIHKVIQGYSYKKPKRGGGSETIKIQPIPGEYSFVRLGPALFNEYRHLGDRLPPFKEIAKYVFYTETSRECDLSKINETTGFIGSTDAAGGTSYYLLYSPNRKVDMELSLDTLAKLLKKDKNRNWVIYCERIWLHGDQLRKFERDHNRRIRPMLVPFNLK